MTTQRRREMLSKWEVFDRKTGAVEVVTCLKWAAMFIAWVDGLAYAKGGESGEWIRCGCVKCGGNAPVALHHDPINRADVYHNYVGDGPSGYDFHSDTRRWC